MARNRIFLFFLPFLALSLSFKTIDDHKWVSLFNGKDLDGWKAKIAGYPLGENFGNTFRVENGILSVRYDQYDSFRNRFGALYFDKKFTNYRLKVEYRFVGETAPGGPPWGYRDSGIQYHCQGPTTLELNQPFPRSLEYNLHGGNGKDDRPVGEVCANGIFVEVDGKRTESYCTEPTIKRTFHGDQWVTLEIEVRGNTIRHFANGEMILQFKNPRYAAKKPMGRNLSSRRDDAVKSGFISLQSNSAPIDFRKIEIMEY